MNTWGPLFRVKAETFASSLHLMRAISIASRSQCLGRDRCYTCCKFPVVFRVMWEAGALDWVLCWMEPRLNTSSFPTALHPDEQHAAAEGAAGEDVWGHGRQGGRSEVQGCCILSLFPSSKIHLERKIRMSTLLSPVKHCMGSSSQGRNRHADWERKNKALRIHRQHDCLHIKPQETHRKNLIELTCEFSKFVRYKLNI